MGQEVHAEELNSQIVRAKKRDETESLCTDSQRARDTVQASREAWMSLETNYSAWKSL